MHGEIREAEQVDENDILTPSITDKHIITLISKSDTQAQLRIVMYHCKQALDFFESTGNVYNTALQ